MRRRSERFIARRANSLPFDRLRQQLVDGLRQFADLDRLVELDAVVQRDIAQRVGRDVAGEDDEGNLAVQPRAQALRDFDAIQAVGQIVIGQHDIRRPDRAFQPLQRHAAVEDAGNVVTLVGQEKLKIFPHLGVVLDHEHHAGTLRAP